MGTSRFCRVGREVAGLLALALVATASAPGYSQPAEVKIAGNDYAFIGVPEKLPPGRTFFVFENRGKVRHEMTISRLKAGLTVQQAFEQLKTGGRRRDFAEGAAAMIISMPGEASDRVRLALDLKAGESYLVVCMLRETPDSPPHTMLGMYASFTVGQPRVRRPVRTRPAR